MIQFPMHFLSRSQTPSGISTTWSASASEQAITLAVPPEFAGPGGGFSPEDLFGMALANCFVATFKVYAEKSQLAFSSLEVDADLIVDRGEGGKPWMSKIKLKVSLSQVSDQSKAETLLKRTSDSCMILNSVKTEKEFEFKFK